MGNKIDQMIKHAYEAMRHAYTPYSHFQVGACLLTDDDKLFAGCNIENASYSLTLCAEAVAISNMVLQGGRQVKEIVVVSSGQQLCYPCGACRQRLREFTHNVAELKLYFVLNYCLQQTLSLAELLPFSFGPSHLEN